MRRWSTTEASDRVVANPWHDIKHGTVYRVEREAKRERGSTYTYVGLCNYDSILERENPGASSIEGKSLGPCR